MIINWRKSSHSGSGQSDCVELGALPEGDVGVRDSKAPQAGHLTFSRQQVAGLVNAIKAGEGTWPV